LNKIIKRKDSSTMKKVLVIIDMQNDFIDGPLGNDECKQAVPAVIDAVNNGGYTDVILTRDTHGDNYLNTQEGRKLPLSP
jgi:nicotinamidase/pyrazinamidase